MPLRYQAYEGYGMEQSLFGACERERERDRESARQSKIWLVGPLKAAEAYNRT